MSLLALTLSASIALATPRSVPGLAPGEPRVDLAAVEHQQTFIRTEREGVNVRVGLLMVDRGGSTDLSAKAGLYLTLFGESEMRGSSAVYFLTELNTLVSAQRVSAGIYEIVVQRYDIEQRLGGGTEPTVRLRVDARTASMDVRAMKGVAEFETGRVQTPITVDEQLSR